MQITYENIGGHHSIFDEHGDQIASLDRKSANPAETAANFLRAVNSFDALVKAAQGVRAMYGDAPMPWQVRELCDALKPAEAYDYEAERDRL